MISCARSEIPAGNTRTQTVNRPLPRCLWLRTWPRVGSGVRNPVGDLKAASACGGAVSFRHEIAPSARSMLLWLANRGSATPLPDTAVATQTDFHKTKVESVLGRKGAILVKVIHDLGGFAGSYNSQLSLSTLRLLEPGNEENCSEGIRIEVADADNQSHISFLDMDEVDSLLSGLEYMDRCINQSKGYRGDYTEMIFSTRGDFSAGFYLSDGKAQAFVKSSYKQAFMPTGALQRLAGLVRAGQTYLRSTPVVTIT